MESSHLLMINKISDVTSRPTAEKFQDSRLTWMAVGREGGSVARHLAPVFPGRQLTTLL